MFLQLFHPVPYFTICRTHNNFSCPTESTITHTHRLERQWPNAVTCMMRKRHNQLAPNISITIKFNAMNAHSSHCLHNTQFAFYSCQIHWNNSYKINDCYFTIHRYAKQNKGYGDPFKVISNYCYIKNVFGASNSHFQQYASVSGRFRFIFVRRAHLVDFIYFKRNPLINQSPLYVDKKVIFRRPHSFPNLSSICPFSLYQYMYLYYI